MAWDPEIYNKFKSERSAPFIDLLALIKVKHGMDVIDYGCGTGELTRKLADALPGSNVLGIDSSREMLGQSKNFANEQVTFEYRSIEEQLNSIKKWDLVFSNAAIQWVENHETLLPKIISTIKPNGQLAIQIPAQHHNISNKILYQLAGEEPYKTMLQNWKRVSPVLDIEAYAQILFQNGSKAMTVYEKIYPLILKNAEAVFELVSGTGLILYMEKLQGKSGEIFTDEYKKRLHSKFDKCPVFYPFKRIIMEATF